MKRSSTASFHEAPNPEFAPSDERSDSGILLIQAPPAVTSLLGRQVLGTGRVQTRLPVGRETVRFSWPGEEGREVTVQIKPGAVTQVDVSPER